MIKNYFVIAFRNFWRNKIFSLIHILGLSIGICASVVIFLIVYYEFSFDRFQQDRERIFRVVLNAQFGEGAPGHSAAVPAPLGSALKDELTGIELVVPVFQFQGDATAKVTVLSENPENPLVFKKQKDVVFTNDEYFKLIPYRWIVGSPLASMKNPFNVVLSESRARAYFPSLPLTSVLGKQMRYNDDLTVTVSGVVEDLKKNTAFTATEFISLNTISKTNLNDRFMMNTWNDWMAYSQLFVKIAEGSNALAVESQIRKLYKKHTAEEKSGGLHSVSFQLQPLSDIHFNSDYPSVGKRTADKRTLYSLLAVAAFLLLLGCINFINLSTAKATQRAREIGIRKTIGSSRTQLIKQFLIETFFITALATLVSIGLTPFLLRVFSDFIPEGLEVNLLHQPGLPLFLLLLTTLVSVLAGLYPALVLSGYRPVKVLKNQAIAVSSTPNQAWIRKGLTISQFVIAQFFIIATIVVSRQIDYSLNKELGFKKDAVLLFEVPFDTARKNADHLLNEIHAIPEIEMASTGFLSPADEGVAFTRISYKKKELEIPNVQLRWGDSNYMKLYQIRIIAGRNVRQSDSSSEFLINQTYAKALGFQKPEDALNEKLEFNGRSLPIVGVVKDFHAESVRAPIGPIAFTGGTGTTFHIRLSPKTPGSDAWQSAISKMQLAYKETYPDSDFNYRFLDETIANFYASEQKMSRLMIWSTGLMIFISCLGLLGLVIYTTNRRTKEIGVRKILGASVYNIVTVLSKDYVRLVLLAFLIAAPLAWWAAHRWLENYAYRTAISWWIFVLTALLILVVAFVTLSIQTIRAATANPVKNLRTE